MTSDAKSVDEYMRGLPEERKGPVEGLRQVILGNLDSVFREEMSYGMIGYVVPLEYYPAGYECRSKDAVPLPFINLASQKNHIGFYHMGLYADSELLEWFRAEYAARVPTKLDMGKSCVRFRNPARIPFELIGELTARMSADRWIALYEESRAGRTPG
ncbi:MAG: DUF1801 domain-containing protein [Spirochaetales bacterium]|nr:DUF1801 domain-containing protein [Spirochaetales bacterium]